MMNWLYTRGKLCAAGLLALALVLSSVDAPAPAQAQARSCYEAIFEMRETTLPPMLGGGTIRRLVKVGEKFDEACYTVGDDRVNQDNAASVAIYCRPEGIAIWDIDVTGRGTPLFLVSHSVVQSLPQPLAENTLLAEYGGYRLYALTSGELQLNGPPDWEGKSYEFIWDGCPQPE
ncbi:MAG: hypothetical protein DIU68_014905 [Chloroflexota bacterium]|nr:MAG: hypothetical protein DIU68_16555 [Chloroflexota bacterium]